jgi:hypothetical protein
MTLREKVAFEIAYYRDEVDSLLVADRILAITEADARERERNAFVAGAVWDRVATSGEETTEAARRYKP